jgi:hypothetical protein
LNLWLNKESNLFVTDKNKKNDERSLDSKANGTGNRAGCMKIEWSIGYSTNNLPVWNIDSS